MYLHTNTYTFIFKGCKNSTEINGRESCSQGKERINLMKRQWGDKGIFSVLLIQPFILIYKEMNCTLKLLILVHQLQMWATTVVVMKLFKGNTEKQGRSTLLKGEEILC